MKFYSFVVIGAASILKFGVNVIIMGLYSVSQKNPPPLKFSDMFSQMVGNF